MNVPGMPLCGRLLVFAHDGQCFECWRALGSKACEFSCPASCGFVAKASDRHAFNISCQFCGLFAQLFVELLAVAYPNISAMRPVTVMAAASQGAASGKYSLNCPPKRDAPNATVTDLVSLSIRSKNLCRRRWYRTWTQARFRTMQRWLQIASSRAVAVAVRAVLLMCLT